MPENAATLKAANEAREVSGSGATDCSLAVHVPEIPAEAIGFAEAMAALAKEHGIRECEMSIRVDTGYRTRFWNDHELREKTQERMTVHLSRVDGRGRPRTKLSIEVESKVQVPIVWEPDSSN